MLVNRMKLIEVKSNGSGPDSIYYINVKSINAIYEHTNYRTIQEPRTYVHEFNKWIPSNSSYDQLIQQLKDTKLFASTFIEVEGYTSTEGINGLHKRSRVLIRKSEINYIETYVQPEDVHWPDDKKRYVSWIHLYTATGEENDNYVRIYLTKDMVEKLRNC